MPVGGYLALFHEAADFHPADITSTTAAAYDRATAPIMLRTVRRSRRSLDGFTPEEPGLVQAPLCPNGRRPRPKDIVKIGIYAG